MFETSEHDSVDTLPCLFMHGQFRSHDRIMLRTFVSSRSVGDFKGSALGPVSASQR